MISAFEIYLVMQLDSISGLFAFAAVASGLSTLMLAMIGFCDDKTNLTKLANKALIVTVLSAIVSAFIPSSKTAAAMIVIPAIVNNEKLQAEAGELYELAKAAIRDAATDKKPE